MNSLDGLDNLMYVLAEKLIPAAAIQYYKFKIGQNPVDDKVKLDAEESVDYIRSKMVQSIDSLAKQATSYAENYLTTFGVNSNDIDYYKFAHFFCISLSEDGSLEPHHKKIAKMMGVLVLDGFLTIDTGIDSPCEFPLKMCKSIYTGSDEVHYGKYGIYTAFKFSSKCLQR